MKKQAEVPFPEIPPHNNGAVPKLNGSTPGSNIGPGVILKVMAGDKIRARSFVWHQAEGDREVKITTIFNVDLVFKKSEMRNTAAKKCGK